MNQDTIRGWNFRLQNCYEDILKQYALGLKPATVRIEPLNKKTLGLWQKGIRLITICSQALNEHSWQDIVLILKHETAHQFVDEARNGGDKKAHGKAFVEACTILQIPHTASVTLKPTKEHPVSRKIEKLMALATSCNQHEAEAALAKAQDLAFKHNIEQINTPQNDYSFRPIGPWRKKVPSYEKFLLHILEEYYFIKALTTWRYGNETNACFKQYEIYGSLENLETASYVYEFLSRETEHLWRMYRQENGPKVARMRNSFINGLYHGFSEKLKEEKEVLKNKYEIVKLDDPQLDDFFYRCNPNVKRSSYSYRTNTTVYNDGLKAGATMKVRPGLKAKRSSKVRGFLQ